jgi:hypothetical protein
LTVSDVPSSATDPLGAMKRASSGARNVKRRASPSSRPKPDLGHAINMTADHVSAKLITDLQRTLEIDPGALAQTPIVVSLSASSQASTSNQRAVSPSPQAVP